MSVPTPTEVLIAEVITNTTQISSSEAAIGQDSRYKDILAANLKQMLENRDSLPQFFSLWLKRNNIEYSIRANKDWIEQIKSDKTVTKVFIFVEDLSVVTRRSPRTDKCGCTEEIHILCKDGHFDLHKNSTPPYLQRNVRK